MTEDMNKNDMENETNNKTTPMNQGKSTGASQGKSPSASSGGSSQGQATGMSSGGSTSGASSQRMGAGAGQGQGQEGGVLSEVQDSGKDLANKGLQALSDKTRSTTEGYKSEITSGLHTLADGLRQTSSSFRSGGEENALASAGARYLGDLANKIESVSGYFERKDAMDLIEDAKDFARRNPTVFVGGAFAVGFALSRVIRSGVAAPTRRTGTGSPMRGGVRGSSTGGAADTSMRGSVADAIRG